MPTRAPNPRYGLTVAPSAGILDVVRRTRNGIYACSANHQTHYADVNAQWGKNSWMNDLYFGLHGGLFVADAREHEVYLNEMRKVAPFVLSPDQDLEIVPYAVHEDGQECLRNDVGGLDFDRCAQYLLMIIRVYEFTGDTSLLTDLHPMMLRVIDWLKCQDRDGDLLLEGRSLPVPITGVGSCPSVAYIGDSVKNDYKDFGASLFFHHLLRRLAMAERIIGQSSLAEEHDAHADRLRDAIDRIFWNEPTGGYLAFIEEDGTRNDNWITGNNLHAVWSGLANEHQSRAILNTLNTHRDILIDMVPCRVSLHTYPPGYSSNPDYYYWNAGCWTLVSAPVMLGYRHVGDALAALHVMDVLASNVVAKTELGFYESYWSNTRQNNACEGLLMNNGGILWGFHEGVLGIGVEGDTLKIQSSIPLSLLPCCATIRYRGRDLAFNWNKADSPSATINDQPIQPTNGQYVIHADQLPNQTVHIHLRVNAGALKN